MAAEITTLKTAAEMGLAEAFAALRAKFPDSAVAAQRDTAFRRFEAKGLPQRHVEEWKYTDLRALMRDAKPLAGPPDAAAKARAAGAGALFGEIAPRRIVFVDGAFVPELSDLDALERGLTITSLAAALGSNARLPRFAEDSPAEADIAYALNTAFMGDGVIIDVANGAHVARPLHLVFAYGSDSPVAVFLRSALTVGACATLTLIESHEGPDGVAYQINSALDLTVGDGAKLNRVNAIREGRDALYLGTLSATIGARAEVNDLGFLTGGNIVRNQLFVKCAGPGAKLSLNGASLITGRQHADTSLMLDHAVAGCTSCELYKSVLDGSSQGIFQGKIVVRPEAQKTDARMMTRALLLSEEAEADNKPELEIFADDVQCGHGATSGALDDNLKFYLMARGIPEKQAETLLIQSFVAEAIETMPHEGLRDALMEATLQWLAGRP